MENNDITKGLGIEIRLIKPDNFLIIKETLSRIGIFSPKRKALYQTAHILHKQGRYFIVMFKEMFVLDGKIADIDSVDINRRNYIANLLAEWKLIEVIDPSKTILTSPVTDIKILSHDQAKKYELKQKYEIGTVKKY